MVSFPNVEGVGTTEHPLLVISALQDRVIEFLVSGTLLPNTCFSVARLWTFWNHELPPKPFAEIDCNERFFNLFSNAAKKLQGSDRILTSFHLGFLIPLAWIQNKDRKENTMFITIGDQSHLNDQPLRSHDWEPARHMDSHARIYELYTLNFHAIKNEPKTLQSELDFTLTTHAFDQVRDRVPLFLFLFVRKEGGLWRNLSKPCFPRERRGRHDVPLRRGGCFLQKPKNDS